MVIQTPASAFDLMQYIRTASFTSLVILSVGYPDLQEYQTVLAALEQLSQSSSSTFVQVNLNTYPDATQYFSIQKVPTVLLYQATTLIHRLQGAQIPLLIRTIESSQENFASKLEELTSQINNRLESIVNSAPVVLFIKGTREQPKCKFTRHLLSIVQGFEFQTFDILEDDTVREWMKKYSDWPTFPQVYVKGEFVGGVDIIEQLSRSGELRETLIR